MPLSLPRKVILLVLDGFPAQFATPKIAPCLYSLATASGQETRQGICDLPSTTYPGHASLVTGVTLAEHRVFSGLAGHPRRDVVPGWAGLDRPAVPTLFSACREAGIQSAAVFGDQFLYHIIGADQADICWPAGGIPPEDSPRDAYGYLADRAVFPPLLAVIKDPSFRFVFGHLNETDTAGHIYGPHHSAAQAAYSMADSLVAEFIGAMSFSWPETVVIVVSDHGMERKLSGNHIDLEEISGFENYFDQVLNEGGCALLRLKPGATTTEAEAAIFALSGMAACRWQSRELLQVEGKKGIRFTNNTGPTAGGFHGGPGTAETLAIVGGGHPAVAAIARSINRQPPHLADWAVTIAAMLNLELPRASGRNLLEG